MKYLMDMRYGKNEDVQLLFFNEITGKIERDIQKIATHRPYFIADDKQRKTITVKQVEPTTKISLFNHPKTFYKHYVNSPKLIHKVSALYDSARENRIPYLDRLKYDQQWHFGMPYSEEGKYLPDNTINPDLIEALSEYPEYIIKRFVPLFQTRLPLIEYIGFDLEIDHDKDRFPDINQPTKRILSAAFHHSSGKRTVYALHRTDVPKFEEDIPDIDIEYFDSEAKLITAIFAYFDDSEEKIILTFNGDEFDFPYLTNRARWFKIEQSVINVWAFKTNQGTWKTRMENKFHLDLYQFFKNPSIKNYVFKGTYKFDALNDVAEALLGERKFDVGEINTASLQRLGYYNWKDAELLIKLMEVNHGIVPYIMFLFMRIGKISLEDACRRYISKVIGGMFLSYLIDNGYVLPTRNELNTVGHASTTSVIKGKKYQGANVEATKGFFTDVTAPDFASLYPSAIKQYNLSPETINCGHVECINNIIKGTTHHACKLKKGVVSLVVGFFKDLRVNYYKPLAKTNLFANNIQEGLKVFINAVYGVLAAYNFPLVCIPVSDCTTAIGRQAFNLLKEKCEEYGIFYIGGDTDSAFLQTQDRKKLDKLCKDFKEEMGLDLDYSEDEMFIWFGMYKKKNYIGKKLDGKMMIKGLVGKKKHVPLVIKEPFEAIMERVSKVDDGSDLPEFISYADDVLSKAYQEIMEGKDYDRFAFRVTLGKDLNDYKVNGEYVKVGRLIPKARKGTIIKYVKGINRPYWLEEEVVKPDREKYMTLLNNALGQLMEIFDYDVLKTAKKFNLQRNMLRFFT